jgi:hypothetical protein
MGLFEILMGAGQNQQEYEDFARRYEQGAPWEGYSDQEVIDRYGQVAHKLPSSDYEAAVREALSRLSPAQQAELGRYLQERAAGREVALPPPGQAGGAGGLDGLARSVRELHERPGRLREVLTAPSGAEPGRAPGSAGAEPAGVPPDLGGIFASPLAKAALAGIAAMLVRRMLAPR